MKYSLPICTLVLCGVVMNAAQAWTPSKQDIRTLLDKDFRQDVSEILSSEIVTRSVENSNEQYQSLNQSGIDNLDTMWRKQESADDQYFIAAILSGPLSAYLTRMQADSKGLYTAIFIMNDKGLNVGQSAITSDFWQGDEAKWQKTYLKGAGSVFIDEPEYDKENDIWIAQYNIAIADNNDRAIGSATFDVNLTELARRHGGFNDAE